jgi:hypothetical protein
MLMVLLRFVIGGFIPSYIAAGPKKKVSSRAQTRYLVHMTRRSFLELGISVRSATSGFKSDSASGARRRWAGIVGTEIMERARASPRERTLFVRVDHGAWMQELHFIERTGQKPVPRATTSILCASDPARRRRRHGMTVAVERSPARSRTTTEHHTVMLDKTKRRPAQNGPSARCVRDMEKRRSTWPRNTQPNKFRCSRDRGGAQAPRGTSGAPTFRNTPLDLRGRGQLGTKPGGPLHRNQSSSTGTTTSASRTADAASPSTCTPRSTAPRWRS